jgi:hypothetical protein
MFTRQLHHDVTNAAVQGHVYIVPDIGQFVLISILIRILKDYRCWLPCGASYGVKTPFS